MKIILHHSKNGNNQIVAERIAKKIQGRTELVENNPNLDQYDLIVLVLSNCGDEELMPQMEQFLTQLTTLNKNYIICELGSQNGIFYTGCKKVAIQILKKLNWTLINEISIDSTPSVNEKILQGWLNALSNDDYRNSKYGCTNRIIDQINQEI